MGELIKVEEQQPVFTVEPGLTIAQILERANVPDGLMQFVVVTVNGTELSADQHAFFVVRQDDHIGIYVRPGGGDDGKQILRLIATIVVAVVAYVYGGPLGAALGFTGKTAAAVGSAVIATVGSLVINALIPPPSINLPNNNFDSGESYFITGQRNTARPYQVVPVVYGRTKMVGNLAAQPEVFSAGDSTLFTALIDWGLGNTNVFNIRAGDTKISFFSATILKHVEEPKYADPLQPEIGLAPVPLQLLQYPLSSQELSVGLSKDGDSGTASTVPTAYSAVVELYFPQGIAYYDKNGDLQALGVTFKGEWRKAGDTEWLGWPEGTQGFAGDAHIRFGAGSVDPGDPNPPETPSLTISVPTVVDAESSFVISLSFGQDVYDVEPADFDFFRASDTQKVNDLFTVTRQTEVTPNRLWQYEITAPAQADDSQAQYFITTNLQNFRDAPIPDGVPFPDTPYTSNNFSVKGQTTGPDPGEDDTNLYDRTPGNETFVYVNGSAGDGYIPGDPSTYDQVFEFEVWVDGATIPVDSSDFRPYAGTFQAGTVIDVFESQVFEEWWSLKNADGSIDPPDPDAPDPSLYDETRGNETYVQVEGIAPYDQPYDPNDPLSFTHEYFRVFVGGEKVYWEATSDPNAFKAYASGVRQNWSTLSATGGKKVYEYYALANADGSPNVRESYDDVRVPSPKFIYFPPNWDPTPFSDRFSIYGDEVKPAKASIVIQFPEQGEYEIRITRIGDTENRDDNNQYFNAAYWSRIASRGYPFTDIDNGRRSILNLQRIHTLTEIRLEASERVQGNLNEISATCVSRLRRYDWSTKLWTAPHNSRNPAWIVADLLTGYRAQQIRYPTDLQDDPGYVQTSQLDMASFVMFASHCNELVDYQWKGQDVQRRRYEIDFVCANEAPLMETISNILGMCRAALIISQSGKLQIILDEDRADQVRQVFTPENSWDFRGERLFPQLPHALRVEFVSPELGYQKGETIVYRPGYDALTATLFEDLKTFGCTNWHMAAQFGMYTFGQMVLRQETFTLKVAAESLVVQRGDVVEIATDVAALGGGTHRIVDHPSADTFILSEEPNIYNNPHYTIKTNEGVFQGDVLGIVGRTVQLDRDFQTVNPEDTNVIVIGEKDLVTKKYIINTIRPLPDFSAEITLVPYDPRSYTTDDGDFPEWTPGGDGDPQNPENGGNARTTDLAGFTYLEYDNRMPISVSSLSWDLLTADAVLSKWIVQYVQQGTDVTMDLAELTPESRGWEHKYRSNSVEFGPGDYTVIPVTQLGYRGTGATVFVGRSVDRTAPPPPRKFRVISEPGMTKFYWERPDAPDIGGYQLYQLRRLDNGMENIDESDLYLATEIKKIDWDETYLMLPFEMDKNGACYWLTCTDTSGNTSYPAYFDGLEYGRPHPGKVEPFTYSEERYVDGVLVNPAWVEWLDLIDPNNLISHYELRYSVEENAQSLEGSVFMSREAPTPRDDRYNYFIMEPNGWPIEGSWWISAVDKFNKRGPWSRCSSGELDYRINIVDHYQERDYRDRFPWCTAYTVWELVGEEKDQVTRIECWLYPRQAESRTLYNNETLYDDKHGDTPFWGVPTKSFGEKSLRYAAPWRFAYTDDMTHTRGWFELPEIPRGDPYHQGEIHIRGLVDYSLDIGKGVGVQEWQMEYDNEGPNCPDPITIALDPGFDDDSKIMITWTDPGDPDLAFVEVRYASNVNKEWDQMESLGFWDYSVTQIFGQQNRPGWYAVKYTDTSGNPGCAMAEFWDPFGDGSDGWSLVQVIQGHYDWDGVLENLERSEGTSTLLLDPSTPFENGVQTAYFYYNEDTPIEQLREVRVVNDSLIALGDVGDPWEYMSDWPLVSDVFTLAQPGNEKGNVEVFHEVKLPGSDLWQEFDSAEFALSGTLEYRIRLTNTIQDGLAGLERSRILIYVKEDATP